MRNKQSKGFTLVELLLYVGITGTLLLLISPFFLALSESRVRNQVVGEVEQQGLQVMHVMTQAIRNAENINLPIPGVSSPSLSLDVVNVLDDPTMFAISSGALYVTEGSSGEIALSNSRVIVSDLLFQNFSRADTPGIVQVQFTVTHINPEGRNEYNYSKTFYGTASLR